MKKFSVFIILIFLSSPLFAGLPDNSKPWEYSRIISGIEIFLRSGSDKGIFEFLAVTSINQPADPVAKTVLDIPSNRYWMADCIYSENLVKLSSDEVIAYYITSPPWPISKRDSVIRIRWEKNAGYTTIRMNSLPRGDAEKYKELNPDFVRIYSMEGSVILEEKNPGQTEIKFSAAAESGGNFPDLLVKMGGWIIPYKTLSGLKKFINSSLLK